MLNSFEELKSGLEASQAELMKNVEASIVDGNAGGATKQADMAIRISEELKNIERLSKLATEFNDLQKKRKEAIIKRDSNKQKIDDEEKDLKVKLEEAKKEPDSKKKKLESDRQKLVLDVKSLVKDAKPEEASRKVREATKLTDELKHLVTVSEGAPEILKVENRLKELAVKKTDEDKKFEMEEIDRIINLLPSLSPNN